MHCQFFLSSQAHSIPYQPCPLDVTLEFQQVLLCTVIMHTVNQSASIYAERKQGWAGGAAFSLFKACRSQL